MGYVENSIVVGDCLDVMERMPGNSIDLVIADPPYPDYHTELYGYKEGMLDWLKDWQCRQLIFWSAKAGFPLDYTAIHIWDKKCGVGSMYERIFERNGGKAYRVFRHYLINSTVAANYTGDVFTGHPSQKPVKLVMELIEKYSKPNNLIFDPFMGSGTTAVAADRLGRRFFGCDISEEYVALALERLEKDRLKRSQLEMPI